MKNPQKYGQLKHKTKEREKATINGDGCEMDWRKEGERQKFRDER